MRIDSLACPLGGRGCGRSHRHIPDTPRRRPADLRCRAQGGVRSSPIGRRVRCPRVARLLGNASSQAGSLEKTLLAFGSGPDCHRARSRRRVRSVHRWLGRGTRRVHLGSRPRLRSRHSLATGLARTPRLILRLGGDTHQDRNGPRRAKLLARTVEDIDSARPGARVLHSAHRTRGPGARHTSKLQASQVADAGRKPFRVVA